MSTKFGEGPEQKRSVTRGICLNESAVPAGLEAMGLVPALKRRRYGMGCKPSQRTFQFFGKPGA